MNKKSIEITTALGSVIVFIILILLSKIVMKSSAGLGYTASLLIFIILMGFAGIKLAQIPDK